jgi:hypothetical protein
MIVIIRAKALYYHSRQRYCHSRQISAICAKVTNIRAKCNVIYFRWRLEMRPCLFCLYLVEPQTFCVFFVWISISFGFMLVCSHPQLVYTQAP